MIVWYKWDCPQGHFQLITSHEEENKERIYCGRCDKYYFVFDGIEIGAYITEDFYGNLKG